jgi:hypothetical protein
VASFISEYLHAPTAPIRGMQLVEVTADRTRFRCALCLAECELPRCAATAARSGQRCRCAALLGFATCVRHRDVEVGGRLPERRSQGGAR